MSNQTCPTALKGAIHPDWELSNFTSPACSVPVCTNNTAILSSCCSTPTSNFTTFSASDSDQQYAACTLPDAEFANQSAEAAGQDYATCLLRGFATAFRCNYPMGDTGIDGGVGAGSLLDTCPPAYPYWYTLPVKANRTICGMTADANSTAALQGCGCGEPYAALQGCFEYCESYSKELESCMSGHNDSRSVFCRWTDASGAAASVGVVHGGTKLAIAVGVWLLVSQLL